MSARQQNDNCSFEIANRTCRVWRCSARRHARHGPVSQASLLVVQSFLYYYDRNNRCLLRRDLQHTSNVVFCAYRLAQSLKPKFITFKTSHSFRLSLGLGEDTQTPTARICLDVISRRRNYDHRACVCIYMCILVLV